MPELTDGGHRDHWTDTMGNVGTLELEPGSAFEGLLGAAVTGPVNGDAVTVTMTVFREMTEKSATGRETVVGLVRDGGKGVRKRRPRRGVRPPPAPPTSEPR